MVLFLEANTSNVPGEIFSKHQMPLHLKFALNTFDSHLSLILLSTFDRGHTQLVGNDSTCTVCRVCKSYLRSPSNTTLRSFPSKQVTSTPLARICFALWLKIVSWTKICLFFYIKGGSTAVCRKSPSIVIFCDHNVYLL